MKFAKSLLFVPFILISCKTKIVQEKLMASEQGDAYLWLEEVEGTKALQYVEAENNKTLTELKKSPVFKSLEAEATQIILAKDRVPQVEMIRGELYNFWQDEKHVRGILRKTTLESYKSANPKWEVILDLDALAKAENENWVWRGSSELPPHFERTLIQLSRGGKDATVVREFNLKTKEFVKDGFNLPEAKNQMSWKDENTVYVGTDFGPGSLTPSGYARVIKLWKRGSPLEQAPVVFEAEKTDMSAHTWVQMNAQKKYVLHLRSIGFYSGEQWYEQEDGKKIKIDMPLDAQIQAIFKDHFLFILRSDLGKFKKGSLVALPLEHISKGTSTVDYLQLVFAPTDKKFLEDAGATENYLMLMTLDNTLGKVVKVTYRGPNDWQQEEVHVGKNGVVSLKGFEWGTDNYLVSYEDFLTPPTTFLLSAEDPKNLAITLKTATARFNAKDLQVQRFESVSKDGTKIPYFMVSKKGLKLDGKNPTLLYGYGGFEVSVKPAYSGLLGKTWMEKGGVYVLANLRGGGEFGPAWHQAVQKENRYKVYEDFISIAEDLIAKKVTSPQHLGIKGGSNGGLLTGATVVLRPDLFNAVLCQVPLLDMLRYHKLLAGASWMDEYGNPEDPQMREAILKYSPYQNVKATQKYPEVFFMTSTKDDRVHPGHARKMFAKMKDQGHQVLYYENTEGGHSRSANLQQAILWNTLEFSYLREKLWHK
ncbi:MAG: S9 family peptidase [Bdellovibrio sp.]|nr:S9 family peptidase [Bdellovibrio sp.]